jgi:hypothetical protein
MGVVWEPEQRVIGPDLLVAVGPKDQGTRVPELPGQEVEEGKGGWIGPVEVVEHHQQRPGIARLAQDGGEAVEHAELLLVGIEHLLGRFRGPWEQLGNEAGEVIAGSSGSEELGRLRVSAVSPEHLDPRPERGRPFPRPAGSPQRPRACPGRVACDLLRQPSFADARLAPKEDQRSAPAAGVVHAAAERRDLSVHDRRTPPKAPQARASA